ncbi:hypothetical protein ACR1PO_21640 [Chryseobacterium sp. RRHN12]|uniref:hypothetical protein n=1 Tax=Chryseobacterium sp. RRHN12 TaxID=3437884 RepID=UPI003D9B67C9
MVVCSEIIKNGKEDFYTIYIPALEKAFQNDSVNLGFYVRSPEDYLDDEAVRQVDQYLKEHEDQFLEKQPVILMPNLMAGLLKT